jgi:SnoaL-like domain
MLPKCNLAGFARNSPTWNPPAIAVVQVWMRHFCTLHGWDATRPCVQCAADGPTREDLLKRAISAQVSGDASDIEELYTPTVTGSSPATIARSREDVAAEIQERQGALAHEQITFGRVESNGSMVRLEWEASGLHIGPLPLPGTGAVLEPTGLTLRIRAVTWARFEGRRIASWRGHWEDVALAS